MSHKLLYFLLGPLATFFSLFSFIFCNYCVANEIKYIKQYIRVSREKILLAIN